MEPLSIRVFGSLEITLAGQPLPPFATRKSRALFAYLLLERDRSHCRDVLLGTFWGEYPEEVARKHLRDALWRVRKVLGPVSGRGVEVITEGDTLRLVVTSAQVDTAEFEARLAGVRSTQEMAVQDAQALSDAIAIYRGELLEEIYDDWCVHERERLRLLALAALQRLLMFHFGRHEWAEALRWAQRLLALEPLHELVHRTVMTCHAELGNRGAALRQYESCVRLLRGELQVEPTEDTIALYERIRNGSPRARDPSSNREPAVPDRREPATEALRGLRSADAELARSRRHLRESARAIRRSLTS